MAPDSIHTWTVSEGISGVFLSQLLEKSLSLNFLNNLVKDVKVNNLTAVSLRHAEATKKHRRGYARNKLVGFRFASHGSDSHGVGYK